MTMLSKQQPRHGYEYRADYDHGGDQRINRAFPFVHSSHPFELGAWCLVIVVALPMFVFAGVLLYTTFG